MGELSLKGTVFATAGLSKMGHNKEKSAMETKPGQCELVFTFQAAVAFR